MKAIKSLFLFTILFFAMVLPSLAEGTPTEAVQNYWVISRAAADFVERSTAMSSKNEAKLERQIAELEAKVDHLSSVVVSLSAQLTAAGITPVATPDAWRR